MSIMQDANDRGWFRTEPSRTKGKPDMSIILPTALELAEGLGYLHEQGILHGDLSPGNVLLADEPSAPHGFTVKVNFARRCSNAALQTWKEDRNSSEHIRKIVMFFVACRLQILG